MVVVGGGDGWLGRMHTCITFSSWTQMFEGKERRKDLVKELRTTHALQAPEQKEKKKEEEEVLTLQHKREATEHKVSVESGGVERMRLERGGGRGEGRMRRGGRRG